jgi:hypothetical protein
MNNIAMAGKHGQLRAGARIPVDANFGTHGFSRSADGAFTIFDAPGAGTSGYQGTRPSTNNLSGEVAGWYIDAENVYHGFLWRPDAH